MDGREIEPRKTIWAVAEVCWQEADGTSFRAPATLEDTSISGACVRVKRPFAVGSRVMIRWHREQFPAIARNCRQDGREFLLGVHRELVGSSPEPQLIVPDSKTAPAAVVKTEVPCCQAETIVGPQVGSQAVRADAEAEPLAFRLNSAPSDRFAQLNLPMRVAKSPPRRPLVIGKASDSERKVMQPKSLIPQFWRRQPDPDAPVKPTTTEAAMNKPTNHASDAPSGARNELLSYEDIYRAAGIMSPGSGYGIHKVVDMLNSDRIRDLSKDVKRSSVLMALDAAGISVDELLTDATRRQNALNSYESGQRKQLEAFETRKAQENARIEEEMEKIRGHYAERVQSNLDLVAREKDSLRNWQSAMQHESQRIAEVIELCGKQPATRNVAIAAAAGASSAGEGSTAPPGTLPTSRTNS